MTPVGRAPRPAAHGATRSPTSPVATPAAPALAGFTAVQQALSALDRLEVRGRDSAGLHLLVLGPRARPRRDPRSPALLAGRAADPLFALGLGPGAPDGALAFVYKAAAEIGELGDNTAALRAAIARRRAAAPGARRRRRPACTGAGPHPLGERRHHLRAQRPSAEPRGGGRRAPGPYVVAVLNGDVDNHADLKVRHGLRIPAPITTDAKVIPALVSRGRPPAHGDLAEAFRRTVAAFEGSVAIGAASADQPDEVLLALRGSGQALYVGLADDAFIVASEPYGVVEETSHYLRIDGETPSRADQPGSRGQVFVLDGARAGRLEGIRRSPTTAPSSPLDRGRL